MTALLEFASWASTDNTVGKEFGRLGTNQDSLSTPTGGRCLSALAAASLGEEQRAPLALIGDLRKIGT